MAGVFATYAPFYFRRGINPIPVVPNSKIPRVKWQEWTTSKMTEAQLAYLISEYPTCNVGIVTGRVSNLIVIDVDGEQGEVALSEYMMPETLKVKTRRGYHLYYKLPENCGEIRSSTALLPNVDIRADGGYVVAPESGVQIESTFFKYKFSENPEILRDIPIVPEWVLQKLRLRASGILPRGKEAIESYHSRQDYIKEIINGVGEGSRNDACARYAGHLINKGHDEDSAYRELLEWNLKNTPPLPEQEVLSVLKSILVKDRLRHYTSVGDISLATAKETINKFLYFEDDSIIDIILATAKMYNQKIGPVWLVIVGPPSSGKTELLRALRTYKDTIFIESITARTLFTGAKGVSGILERYDQEYLLMINKDFGSILAKPSGEKSLILQQLRGIFDSDYSDETGSGKGPIKWSNRLNFISAATYDIEGRENQKVLADLGERFLYFKMRQESDDVIRNKAFNSIISPMSDNTMRNIISDNMIGVLKKYDAINADDIVVPELIAKRLVEICMLAVKMRTRVKREGYKSDIIEYRPSHEGIMRMLKSVKGLMVGLTIIRDKKTVDMADYNSVCRVIMDSIPSYRKTLLKILFFKSSPATIKDVMRTTNLAEATVKMILDDFCILGIAERGVSSSDTDTAIYRLKESTINNIRDSSLDKLF